MVAGYGGPRWTDCTRRRCGWPGCGRWRSSFASRRALSPAR